MSLSEFGLYRNTDFSTCRILGRNIIIPSDWKLSKANDICDIRDGTHSSPKYISKENGGVPFITSKNLINNHISFQDINFISKEDFLEFNKRSKVQVGDILFGMIGTIGSPTIVKTNIEFAIKNVALFRTSCSTDLNALFLLNSLNGSILKDQLKRFTNGGVQSFLSLGTIRKLNILLPSSIEEQTRIADILTKQEDLIEHTKEKISKLKKQKKYFQQELLSGRLRMRLTQKTTTTKGLKRSAEGEALSLGLLEQILLNAENESMVVRINIVEGKQEEFENWLNIDFDSKIEFYKNLSWKEEKVNGRIIDIPFDWNVDKIINNLNFIKGTSISEQNLNYTGEGLQYLKTTEFWLDASSKKVASFYNGIVDKKFIKDKSEYVFSLDGFNSKIGKGTLGLLSKEGVGIVSTHFLKLEYNFLYFYFVNTLQSNYFQNILMTLGEGSVVSSAHKYLKKLEIIKPTNIVETKLYSVLFEKTDNLIEKEEQNLKKEEKRFKFLQQELLSGRIRTR